MHVLMIAPTSFFSDYGGHIRIYEETLALQRLGHRITIVTYYKGRDLPHIDIRRTHALPWRADYEVGSSRHKLAFDVYLGIKSLKVALRERPDVIHGHMHEGALIGAVLAKLLRVPLVFDFQGSLSAEMVDHNFLNPAGSIYKIVHRVEKWIDHRPDAILTSSLRAQRQLTDEFGVPAERVHALPDCVDLSRFDAGKFGSAEKAKLRTRLGIPPNRTIIAYLGLLADYQGVPHMLRAAHLLKTWEKNAHFLIMGYPNVDAYQQMANDMGVGDVVTLPGKIRYDLAPLYLSLGDIAISAKMSATEGSGKVLNYMALGQPIVAYDNPVHREYLADLGIYPPSGNADALAIALARLIDRGETAWRTLGNKLRQRARDHYDWQHAAQQIESLYTQLLAQ